MYEPLPGNAGNDAAFAAAPEEYRAAIRAARRWKEALISYQHGRFPERCGYWPHGCPRTPQWFAALRKCIPTREAEHERRVDILVQALTVQPEEK